MPVFSDPIQASEALRLHAFLRHRPTEAEPYVRMGEFLESAERQNDALPWFERAAQLEPNVRNLRTLVDRYTWQSRPKDALPYLEQLRRLEPENPEWERRLAEAAEWAGNSESAAELHLGLYRQTRRDEHLQKAIERYLWANKPGKALPLLRELLKIRPRDATVWEQYADTAEWAKNLPLAIKALQQANRLRPSRTLRRKIVERLFWNGNTKEAETALQPFLPTIHRDPPLHALYAELLDAQGLATQTRAILEQLPPRELTPLRRLRRAQLRHEAGDLPQAQRDLELLLRPKTLRQLDARNRFSCQVLAAQVDLALRRPHLAHERLQQLQRQLGQRDFPALTGPEQLSLLRLSAEAAREAGDRPAEEQTLSRLAQLEADPTASLSNLAWYSRERGDFATARLHLEKALQIQPNDVALQRAMVDTLIESQATAAARPWLEPLVASAPHDPYLRWLMIAVLEEQRDWAALLPYRWEDYLATPSRDTLLALVPALEATEHRQKAAELLLAQLRNAPFDADLEQAFHRVAAEDPVLSEVWSRQKPRAISESYEALISSYSARLAADPGDREARRARAEVRLWQQQPRLALPDYRALVASEPQNAELLREAVEIAEWSGDLPQTIDWREQRHRLVPDDASNTLMLARHLGWNQKQHRSLPYYEKILSGTATPSADVVITAIPVCQWAGKAARVLDLWRRIKNDDLSRVPEPRSTWRKEQARLARVVSHDVGPVLQVRQMNRRDTEEIAETRVQVFARHQVRDGSRQETRLDDLSMTQNKYDHRGFRGRWFRHLIVRPSASGRERQLGLSAMDNRSDRDTRLYWPLFGQVIRRHGRETTWNIEEEPVFDTPEALRRGLTLRRFSAVHYRPTSNRSSIGFWTRIGRYSDGNSLLMGGFSAERLTKLDPRQGWRYQYSRHHTQGDGGNVYYTPGSVGTHQLVWFGEREFSRPSHEATHLAWEAFVGQEEGRASFHGVRAILQHSLTRDWHVRAEGGYLSSSRSHFGSGSGGYGQWDWNVQLEKTWW